MFTSIVSVVVLGVLAHKEPIVHLNEIEAFKKRVHFSVLDDVQGVDGVLADWDELARGLPQLKGTVEIGDATALEPGEARKSLIWTTRDRGLTVWIFVSGAGYRRAHERLLSEASNTTRVDIPFRAGPPRLGDFSVRDLGDPASTIIWVYRNVCVEVSDHALRDAEPIARAVQAFLEAHRVGRLAEHLPRVDRVDRSSKEIRVGEEWRVRVTLGKSTPAASVVTRILEWQDGYLDKQSTSSSFEGVFLGNQPGTARVGISIVDRKTLLSPPLSVTVDVLPAR